MAKVQIRACLKTNILSYLHFSQSAIAVRPRADPDGGPKGWIWHCRQAVHQPESAASMITPLAKGEIPQWVGVFGQALSWTLAIFQILLQNQYVTASPGHTFAATSTATHCPKNRNRPSWAISAAT